MFTHYIKWSPTPSSDQYLHNSFCTNHFCWWHIYTFSINSNWHPTGVLKKSGVKLPEGCLLPSCISIASAPYPLSFFPFSLSFLLLLEFRLTNRFSLLDDRRRRLALSDRSEVDDLLLLSQRRTWAQGGDGSWSPALSNSSNVLLSHASNEWCCGSGDGHGEGFRNHSERVFILAVCLSWTFETDEYNNFLFKGGHSEKNC